MKYKDRNYLQLCRDIFKDELFLKLSASAKWLYVVLVENEHRFTGKKEDFFFRSNQDLAKDSGMSIATVKRAKKELQGYINTWQLHFVDAETKKKSHKHITGYRFKE